MLHIYVHTESYIYMYTQKAKYICTHRKLHIYVHSEMMQYPITIQYSEMKTHFIWLSGFRGED